MKTTQHSFNSNSQWILYSNTFDMIQNSLKGGILTLKAYKDYTCELPITLIIDADRDEIFISITIINTRATKTFSHPPQASKYQTTLAIIDFIESVANSGIDTGNGILTLSFFNQTKISERIKNNIKTLNE